MENISLNGKRADACQYLFTLWEAGPGIIHSSNKYLLRTYYVPDIILGTGDIWINKADKILVLMEFHWSTDNRQ